MPLYAFSLVAVAAIAAWSAVHHGLVAWRQRNVVERSFALLALAVATECVCRVVYHDSTSLRLLITLDGVNSMLQLAEGWLLLDFVDRFTGGFHRRLVAVAGAALGGCAILYLALPHGFMATAPAHVIVHEMPWGEGFALLDAPYGAGYWVMIATASATLLACVVLAAHACIRTRLPRHGMLLGSLLLIVSGAAVNIGCDIVGIVFPPVVEYGFAGLALLMGLVLTDQALTAARLEERLRRNERLTALGQLAGGVAHDFGNILTGVIGSAELLEQSLEGKPKEQELIRAVGTSGRRGLALVQQLTAFASGRQIASERIELHAMLREIAALVQTGRGRSLVIDLQLQAPLTEIDGDPAQLHSLILNLLVNARDAMGAGGGRIVVRSGIGQPAPGRSLRHRPSGENLVWFSVTDGGPGIPADILPRIFDAFFTTKGDGGTGLGLAQADKALAALGGAVAVDSIAGQGATFTVWLPLTEDSSVLRPAAGTQVLVCVEDATLRQLIIQTLHALGYGTLCTADGVPTERISMLIADAECRCGQHARQQLPDVPAVVLGGERAVANGQVTLGRPFDARDLAKALRTLAGHRRKRTTQSMRIEADTTRKSG